MMGYIAGYLATGFGVLFLQRWVTARYPTLGDQMIETESSIQRRIDSVEYPEGLPFSVSSARTMGEGIALLIGVLGWPLVVFKLWRRFRPAPLDVASNTPADEEGDECIREVTLEEVERLELVSATGAPELPFGFLNPQWLEFKEKLQPGDTLWQYRYVPYEEQPLDAWDHQADGYAIKRGGIVVAKIVASAG